MYLSEMGCVSLYATHDSVVFDLACDSLCTTHDDVLVTPGLCLIVYYT